ncbi:hypothetical protein BCV70DRAFT_203642 [Testicularia cyperi]|uniref:Uncharacterized protein n=1 Tax=Testicularia cyperi TaxID=1882483 RepID=A0A317XWN1_9BASI|nr:hypothetical protein BCV70DRAFT_203642 [Testicularia cyperi]
MSTSIPSKAQQATITSSARQHTSRHQYYKTPLEALSADPEEAFIMVLPPAEIVMARKVSQRRASVVSHSKSNSIEHIKRVLSQEGGSKSPQMQTHTTSSSVTHSPRILPAPVPPPNGALPPTPGRPTSSIATASPVLAQQEISAPASPRVSRRSLSNRGLTSAEQSALLAKILTDLDKTQKGSLPSSRPASASSSRRVSRNANYHSLGPHQRQTSSARASVVLESPIVSPVPNLSKSADSTPSASPSSTEDSASLVDELSSARSATASDVRGASEVDVSRNKRNSLSPSAALESLKHLEGNFADQSPLPSPSKPTPMQRIASSGVSSQDVAMSRTRSSLSSRSRDSQPGQSATQAAAIAAEAPVESSAIADPTTASAAQEQGLGVAGINEGALPAASSPSVPHVEANWAASLSTLEAVRALAASNSFVTSQESDSIIEEEQSQEIQQDSPEWSKTAVTEIQALRAALRFVLSRGDKLTEALKKTKEERDQANQELATLRANVLAMLSGQIMTPQSPNAVAAPVALPALASGAVVQAIPEQSQTSPAVGAAIAELPTQDSTKTSSVAESQQMQTSKSEPLLTKSQAKTGGGVSIASLRKARQLSDQGAPSQHYVPRSQRMEAQENKEDDDDEDDDDLDDLLHDPYAYPTSRRKAMPDVSMTDFLNASRMSKTEIREHDARRLAEENDTFGRSHSQLLSVQNEPARLGKFFNKLSRKGGDGEKSRLGSGLGRRTSQNMIRVKSSSHSLAPSTAASTTRLMPPMEQSREDTFSPFEEESIIPPASPDYNNASYRSSSSGGRSRSRSSNNPFGKDQLSMNSSLRESVERQGLREAKLFA